MRAARARGLPVVRGSAERLPFADGCADGIVCKVVVPYTDERATLREWARVLRPGGRVHVCYHGPGYYLHDLVHGQPGVSRAYAARTLLDSAAYPLLGDRRPRWAGTTVCQTRRRLERHYRRVGLEVERDPPVPRFLGLPVFLYQRLRRVEKAGSRGSAATSGTAPSLHGD